MKLAVFSDAACYPADKRSAAAAVGYDVTDPHDPREIFTHGVCVPYCDATTAEYQAAALALEQVITRINHGEFRPEAITLFVDADSVVHAIKRLMRDKPVRPNGSEAHIRTILDRQQALALFGCPLAVEVVSRKYNIRANQFAREVFRTRGQVTAPTGSIHHRYPFLRILRDEFGPAS